MNKEKERHVSGGTLVFVTRLSFFYNTRNAYQLTEVWKFLIKMPLNFPG